MTQREAFARACLRRTRCVARNAKDATIKCRGEYGDTVWLMKKKREKEKEGKEEEEVKEEKAEEKEEDKGDLLLVGKDGLAVDRGYKGRAEEGSRGDLLDHGGLRHGIRVDIRAIVVPDSVRS